MYGPGLDLTRLASPFLKASIMHMLATHGFPADVYNQVRTDVENDPYSDVYPENDPEKRSYEDNTKILLVENITGSNIDQFIALMDKAEGEFTVITLYALKEKQIIEVHFSDIKTLSFLILNSESLHSHETFDYKYYAKPI